MNKLIISLGIVATAAGFAADPMPALAQSAGNQAEVVVYGNDPCPRSTDDQIVVCTRRPEGERYRLPKNQQLQGTRQDRQSWAKRSQELSTVGRTGTNSCSAVGPSGFTGCVTQQIQQAKRESQEQTDQNTAPPQ